MLPAAILAGGLATRMRPITEKVPKALIDIAGKPFVLRQLDYLREQKFEHVVLCVGHLGEQIRSVVGDGARFGMRVRYSFDGDVPLGTGGALRRALPMLGDRFFVIYGDSWTPIDFASAERAFAESGKPAMMTVFENADRWDKSNVLFRNGRLIEYDSESPRPDMRHIDYGVGLLSARALEACEDHEVFDVSSVYHRLSLSGDLAGHPVSERFYEIGSPSGLAETIALFDGGNRR